MRKWLTDIRAFGINRNDFYLGNSLDMKRESYFNRLREHNLKVTPKRKAVINLLLKEERYFSPSEVWSVLRKKSTHLGLPTTYRILEELKSIGILTKIEREDGHLYYFLCDVPHTVHHHHFVCRNCKKVEAVKFCNSRQIARFIEQELDCKTETHFFQIEGLCSQCK